MFKYGQDLFCRLRGLDANWKQSKSRLSIVLAALETIARSEARSILALICISVPCCDGTIAEIFEQVCIGQISQMWWQVMLHLFPEPRTKGNSCTATVGCSLFLALETGARQHGCWKWRRGQRARGRGGWTTAPTCSKLRECARVSVPARLCVRLLGACIYCRCLTAQHPHSVAGSAGLKMNNNDCECTSATERNLEKGVTTSSSKRQRTSTPLLNRCGTDTSPAAAAVQTQSSTWVCRMCTFTETVVEEEKCGVCAAQRQLTAEANALDLLRSAKKTCKTKGSPSKEEVVVIPSSGDFNFILRRQSFPVSTRPASKIVIVSIYIYIHAYLHLNLYMQGCTHEHTHTYTNTHPTVGISHGAYINESSHKWIMTHTQMMKQKISPRILPRRPRKKP